MPKGPNGQNRPGDVIGAAIMVARIATGEVEETGVDRSAAAKRGGEARARVLSQSERSAIARKGAKGRWEKAKAALEPKEQS